MRLPSRLTSVMPIKAGPEVCTTLNVSGVRAGTLGSEPVARKLPPVPETTVSGCTALTARQRYGVLVIYHGK
jgi:hypothetical protein